MSATFHPASRRNGSVLVVVLCVCLGLVSITLLFGHSMLMAYRGADNDLSGRQAEQAIDGAARYVELLMATAETPGLMPDITSYESEAVPVGDATFWFLGRAAETTTNGTTRVFGLVDEASKINLNMRVSDPQIFLDILGKLPGMTAELAAAIIDWRDADEDVTPGGAEAETYNRQTPASSAKNADFESVEELGLVSGATRLILYGEDTNLNGVLDANEDDGETNLPSDNSDGKLDPGILEYLTVFSKESNKQSDGTTARINVTQPGTELTTLLTEKLSASRANEIMASLGTTTRFNSVLAFYVRSGMKPEEFDLVSDSLTTSDGDSVAGLINVNTASETVLACLPGIDTDKASKIVSQRLGSATQSAGIAWVADILGPDGVEQAGPYLTGRSYQISADVAAVGRHGRGYRRTRFVIDNSTGTPQIIYRRNLASLGWALGSDVRESFASTKGIQ